MSVVTEAAFLNHLPKIIEQYELAIFGVLEAQQLATNMSRRGNAWDSFSRPNNRSIHAHPCKSTLAKHSTVSSFASNCEYKEQLALTVYLLDDWIWKPLTEYVLPVTVLSSQTPFFSLDLEKKWDTWITLYDCSANLQIVLLQHMHIAHYSWDY